MLHLALMTILTVGLGGAAAAPAAAADDVTALPAPRERAALHLERGLALLQREGRSDSERLASLVRVGSQAADELGPRASARVVRDAVRNARWRDYLGEEDAWRALADDFARLRADLTFEPLLEAELPLGFPAPTPVLEVELKSYPAYRLARTPMSGPFGNAAFWKLFRHIESNEIAMTAPVEMTYERADDDLEGVSMAFLYGDPALGEAGERGQVEVVDVPAMQTVSTGCRGRRSQARIDAARAVLDEWLARHPDYVADGPLRVMGYNSPMVPTRRSYFEVEIPVRLRDVAPSQR